MKTSRQRILEYLETHRAVTAADISQALRMTGANARRHLSILHERGAVEVIGQRPSQGKGRPAQVFGPANHASRSNLEQLASALLAEIEQLLPPEARQQSLQRIAGRLADPSAQAASQAGAHLTQRLYSAIQQLNKRGYQARWEAHSGAPRLILGHCPFKALTNLHPQVCQIDALFLETLLEEHVDQLTRLAPDARGAPICVFQIGAKH
jgi:predicted ArsR family transcriptional regulator